MALTVSIVNVTDAKESKKSPTRLAIYTTHLDPGEELKLPASMVDDRLRKLEKDGYIVIGQLPSWYQTSKAKKAGKRKLTKTELEDRHKASKEKEKSSTPKAEKKEEPAAPAPAMYKKRVEKPAEDKADKK